MAYELRYGAESSSDATREHAKLDVFLAPFSSLPFDDACAATCAEIRRALERKGETIGPHDMQIAAIALRHDLTLMTHNSREFSRISASAGGLGVMNFDLARLSEDDLVELNRRIVERLQLLRSAKSLAQVARSSVGMVVEFDADDGRTISGTVARLNQRTVTVVAASGRWRVSPSLLRTAAAPQARGSASPRVVALPRRQE